MRRDPAKAILILDAMLEFFDGGRRWTQGELHDEAGQNRCLIGALRYVRQQRHILGAGTQFYLHAAIPSILRDMLDPITFGFFNYGQTPDKDLMSFNDEFHGYDHVRALIVAARALAQAELDAKRDRERSSKVMLPDQGVAARYDSSLKEAARSTPPIEAVPAR